MSRFAYTGLALALAGSLAACTPRYADVPAPARFENATQQKLQAAAHWRSIADHFAAQIASDMSGKLGSRALYVPTPAGEQAFVEGFRELLITALVAHGVPVSVDGRNAMTVDIRYSIYRFSPDRARNTYYYGNATALASGLWAFSAVAASEFSPAASVNAGIKLIAAAAAIDGFGWLSQEGLQRGKFASGPVPRSEILLTASIADAGRLVSRRTNLYYAADEDKDLYWSQQDRGSRLSVVGDCGEGGRPCAR